MDRRVETQRYPPNSRTVRGPATCVFGSVVRGDDRAHSDVDLLVDMDPDRSLLDIVGVGQDLEELLDRRVDVLTGAGLHSGLRDRILAESRAVKDERVYLGHIRDAITISKNAHR